MENPFAAPQSDGSAARGKRHVKLYLLGSSVLVMLALVIGYPGLVLLNQKYDWIPVNGQIYDIEIDGVSVSLDKAMWDSLLTASVPGAIGILLGVMALLNCRHNLKRDRP